jgi:hypothetical protein
VGALQVLHAPFILCFFLNQTVDVEIKRTIQAACVTS